MRPSCPEVGRSQRPDLIAPKRGRRRLSSSANPATSSRNASRAAPDPAALLDQTTTAALPRDRDHLTHGTCRGATFRMLSRHLGIGPAPLGAGHRLLELGSRMDVELAKHVLEMALHRFAGYEQRLCDLAIAHPFYC